MRIHERFIGLTTLFVAAAIAGCGDGGSDKGGGGGGVDTTAPTVSSTSPASAANSVLLTAAITATFSEAMAPATISNSTFTVTAGGVAVPGLVTFDAPSKVATFKSTDPLVLPAVYVATVKGGAGGVTDLAGNTLASNHTWIFTTGPAAAAQPPVDLRSAANYVILAKTGISTVPPSVVTGDMGLSSYAASFITGFTLSAPPTTFSTSTQVIGKVYAADYAEPTPTILTAAISDMETAYLDAEGRLNPDFLELNTGAIGGLTLTPGLYKWTNTVTIPSDVTLSGSATDVWIFQIAQDLTMSSAKNVFLTGGAQAKNVFWQVAGTVAVDTTAHFEGIILSKTGITLKTGSSMNGRALAQTAVDLQSAKVTKPAL